MEVTRAQAEALIKEQMHSNTPAYNNKPNTYHYGLVELAELLDYIYNGTQVALLERTERMEVLH